MTYCRHFETKMAYINTDNVHKAFTLLRLYFSEFISAKGYKF